jgi:hypothetical protein
MQPIVEVGQRFKFTVLMDDALTERQGVVTRVLSNREEGLGLDVDQYMTEISSKISSKLSPRNDLADDLEEMKGQCIWSVRWYGLIERVQLPKPTRPSLSHFHYTLRSPASTQASARTC